MNVAIEKIEILAFGKLKNAVVAPEKGINILSAPNESGKSTLAAFIKFVFYGFAGGRTKSLTENERKLYTPWDSEVSEGSIHLVADGKRYIVHRRCQPSGKEAVEVINRANGKTEFAGKVPGEVFFGVGEAVFARTLFFKQLTLPNSEDDVVAERLRNIAISADEEVGTQKASKRLNDCKNELKGKAGNGLIPAAERERDAVEEALALSESMRKDSQALRESIKMRQKRLSEAEKKLSELNAEKENIEKYEAFLKLKNLKKLSDEEKEAFREYSSASSALKQLPDSSVFGNLTAKNSEIITETRNISTLSESCENSKKQLNSLGEKNRDVNTLQNVKQSFLKLKSKSNLFLAIGSPLALVGMALLLVNEIIAAAVAFVGMCLAIFGAVMIFKGKSLLKDKGFSALSEVDYEIEKAKVFVIHYEESEKNLKEQEKQLENSKKRLEQLKSELKAEIAKYLDTEGEDGSETIQRMLSLSTEIAEKKAFWQSKKSVLDNALVGIDPEALAEQARGAYPPERENSAVERELRFYGSQLKQLDQLNRDSEIECAALEAKSGDPAVLKGKLDSLNTRIEELTLKYKAYEKAMELINQSADYMKSMVMPMLGKRTDEYFSMATGGKYNSLELDTKLSMSFGEGFNRSCDYLSAGTRDSAYLSLRLALADMLFGGCGVPMLLDDAFVRMDDMRLREMSKAIIKASENHQIFILTHGNREAEALDAVNGKYTRISIKNVL